MTEIQLTLTAEPELLAALQALADALPRGAAPSAPPALPPAEPNTPAAPQPTAPEIGITTVRAALKKYVEKHGREKALELLRAHDAQSVSDLKSELYADFAQACEG